MTFIGAKVREVGVEGFVPATAEGSVDWLP